MSEDYSDDGSQTSTIEIDLVYMSKAEIEFSDFTHDKSFASPTSSCS